MKVSPGKKFVVFGKLTCALGEIFITIPSMNHWQYYSHAKISTYTVGPIVNYTPLASVTTLGHLCTLLLKLLACKSGAFEILYM